MQTSEKTELTIQAIDNALRVQAIILYPSIEHIVGRGLTSEEKAKLLEDLRYFYNNVAIVQMEIMQELAFKEGNENESERPSNTLS